MAEIIYPYIPESVTVHLGTPDSNAENVTVSFTDYIKNVASSEIYPTWPETALRANIYVIITYTLNRIYTEWYRSRGYDFDITNSTRYDQAFVKNRDIFQNISDIVDEIFDQYVVKQGKIEPYFTQFCNGTTAKCDGLSQWGTVTLARQGYTPYEMLQYYYGNDINIVSDAKVQSIEESYPGFPLKSGDAGNDVTILQNELNRISGNYPAIPRIPEANGIFDINTEKSVSEFQRAFDLPVTGIVNKATWYAIKRYYVAVKRLTDLISEGVSYSEAEVPFSSDLSEGMSGLGVGTVQYFLNVIGYFNPALNLLPLDNYFGSQTRSAVEQFQKFYGLPVTGIVDRNTWNEIRRIYDEIISGLPEGYSGKKAKAYPGFILSEGMRGNDVRDFQTYISLVGRYYNDIPEIPVTGYFGNQTKNAVITFQRSFGLPVNGVVGAQTWNAVAQQYDYLIETENL